MNDAEETIATYEYDEIGRLKTKKIYPDKNFDIGGVLDYINRPPSPAANTNDVANKAIILNTGTLIDAASVNSYSATIETNSLRNTSLNGLQTIDYTYHIRGGLRGINLDASGNLVPNSAQGDLFSYKLDYETAGFYNGNIGKQSWQSVQNNAPVGLRSYTFNYDASSRLLTAIYAGINSENYSLSDLTYDKNGNIKTMRRKGKKGSAFGDIDNLTYTYNGNRLATVSDQYSDNHEVDLVPRGSGAYTYYTDGSLKSDANEQIVNISYDTYLKQPIQLILTDGRWINYYYDGAGALLKTRYSTEEKWEYAGKLIYKNGVRFQISQQEGRLIYENDIWKPEFQYTDHLGNTRVAFRANGTQLEKVSDTAFDPWGVVLNGINQTNGFQNRFEFLNREKESTFNLNAIRLGARMYNPTIGRFDRVDPLIEEGQQRFTGYHYSFNNPVRFSDPDGLMGEDCCQSVIDFFAGTTLTFIDNNSPVPTSLDGGGYRGSAYETGRKVGNALSIVSGAIQVVGGALGAAAAGGAEVVTAGAASPVALPVGAAAVATIVNGIATVTKAASNLSAQGKNNSSGSGSKKSNVSSGNKNSAHANQKAKDAARERYEKTKAEYDAAKSKPNKAAEDSKLVDKLEKLMKHEKQKMENAGENHSRKAKGSN